MPKVWDCFMFHSELDMAELRFNILHEVVDRFVVVESSETHSGKRKNYDFDIERFDQFKDKIIYVQCGGLSHFSENSWHREAYHRSCIKRGLLYAEPDDWILVSDVDEIVSPERIKQILDFPGIIRKVKFELDMYYYNFNCKVDQGWATGGARYGLGLDPNEIRRCAWNRDDVRFFDAGFHASYFMSPEQVIEKHKAFMHANDVGVGDMPRTVEYVQDKMQRGVDLYGRDIKIDRVPLSDKLPSYVLDNQDKYRSLGWIVG
jgi:beta-1,4-mannosyl-glycoprotein beta-1,4-N-acetylglucosaminyltransferase